MGADPHTAWLTGCGVATDEKGFVVTGDRADRDALETNLPGIYAFGDVRADSVKRVAAAVGGGAQVVAPIHAFLACRQVRAS